MSAKRSLVSAITCLLLAIATPVAADIARYDSMEDYTKTLKSLAEAGDYAALFKAMNATSGQAAAVDGMAATMRTMFGDDGVSYSILFIREGVDGVLLTGAIWKDDKYLYVGTILHRRDGQIVPLQTSVNSDFKKILPFR